MSRDALSRNAVYVRASGFRHQYPLPLAEDPADIPVAARPGAQPNSTPPCLRPAACQKPLMAVVSGLSVSRGHGEWVTAAGEGGVEFVA